MLWKVGGNFGVVTVTCETNWKECVIAVINYLWCEVVSDVADYLTKEGLIWVLAIAIASAILIRIKYRKNTYAKNVLRDKQILNKVGYKIQDLELKVNVLMYKMQYGTWPLPHQIHSLNAKKLQKIRMTLSNPDNRKNGLKDVLLSPVKSNMYAPYTNMVNSSIVKLNNIFDVNQNPTPHCQRSKLLTYCSSIETSKSTSDQSVNISPRRPSTYSRNVNTKDNNLFKSKDYTLQRQNEQLLTFGLDEINHQFSRTLLTQNGACETYSTNAKSNPCQKLTDTVYKCKSFLKELEYSDKRLGSLSCSSETSKTSSLKAAYSAKQSTLFTTEIKKAPSDAHVATEREDINEIKEIKDNKMIKDAEQIYYQNNVNMSDAVAVTSNDGVFAREFIPILSITQSAHNIQSYEETLYEVKKRLQSLHNVLQVYQDMNRSLERQELINQVNKINAFASGSKIEKDNKNKADTNNVNFEKNLRQTQCSTVDSYGYFKFDSLKKSSSSLDEYSSNISKTYQCSNENVTSRNTYSKELDQYNNTQKSIGTNLPMFTTDSYDYRQHSHFYSAILQIPEDYEDVYRNNICEQISNRNHESESYFEANEDTTKTNALFNLKEKISETVSKKICYISSFESLEDQNIQAQNKTSSIKRFTIEKFSDINERKQYQENIISQNNNQSKMSNYSNRNEKSTTLLLQEALHFKKALLTQIRSKKRYPISNVKENDIADGFPPESNNMPPMIVDIQVEEPIINNSRNKINQRYIYLEMKQKCDLFPRKSLQKVNIFTHFESEKNTENQYCIPKTPSKYFSIIDLTIHNNTEVGNNVLLKSPVYEKAVSLMIPVNVESQDKINTNAKSMQTKLVLDDTQTHVNSRKNLKRNRTADDLDDNVIDKHLPTILKLEDLILKHIKNIRSYMNTFLQNRNKAIFKARRALQCQSKSDIFRYLNETSHIILHNQLISPFSCDSNQIVGSSKSLSTLLINTWPNYKCKILIEDEILKYCSNICLKRNPELFEFITPSTNKLSNKNDAQRSEVRKEKN